jgi:23S rRNA (guanosine2251-2'-O)-methyltransferase
MKQQKIYIYGKHAVEEALRYAPQTLRKIHLAKQMDDHELRRLINQSGIPVEPLDPQKVTSQVERNAPHQGVVALVSLGGLVVPFEKFVETWNPTSDTCLVFASEVQDPHNLGAIIRSAAAFGAAAVLMPTHNQAPVTGVVVKSSAGMAFRIPLVSVENTQQAIAQIKKKGIKVYGLAGEAKNSLTDEEFDTPTMFVLGNEGQGIAPAARALCDTILSIPINERAESLNVSASSAVALYAWSTQHTGALKK